MAGWERCIRNCVDAVVDTVWRLGTIPKSHGNSHSEESVFRARTGHPSSPTPTPKLRLWNELAWVRWTDQQHTVREEIHELNNGSVGELGTDWQICSFELRLPNRGFPMLFPQLWGKCQGILLPPGVNPTAVKYIYHIINRKDGARPEILNLLPNFFLSIVFFSL
jgi:hypothetical protein